MEISNKKILDLYNTMVKIRLFEDRIVDLYARGLVPGLAHLYIGEEAIAAGAYLSQLPAQLASIRVQDIFKFIALGLIILGWILVASNSNLLTQILTT